VLALTQEADWAEFIVKTKVGLSPFYHLAIFFRANQKKANVIGW
jgi:hypothetical protein